MFDRKKYAEGLKERVRESNESKDQGLFGGSIIRPDLHIQTWKCAEGKHYLDIIPYIAGKNNSRVKEGKPAYNLDIWVHYGVGPNDDAFVCLSKNYKEPCPICEQRKEVQDLESSSEDLLKSLLPKRRTLYNIICYDSKKEEEKGIQVWDVSHFFVEQKLASISERPRQGGFVDYPDPDNGKQIMFERKGTGAANTQFLGHAFVDRDYVISDEVLTASHVLDELIVIPTYEEVFGTLHGKRVVKESEIKEPEAEVPTKEQPSPSTRREERARQRQAQTSKNPCPANGKFGEDVDKWDNCRQCESYDPCADEFDRLEKEAASKTAPATGRRLSRG